MPTPSKSAVRKAGKTIRKHHRGEEITEDQYNTATHLISQYRAAHQAPLNRITANLRATITHTRINAAVTQRVKRLPTILEKLTRQGISGVDDLSRMGDIGGCRIVTDNRTSLYKIKDILEQRWQNPQSPNQLSKTRDYIKHPRESGYRAIHLQVERDGLQFEVQLRDKKLHDWAETVEAFSGDLGINYKQDGNAKIQELMQLISIIDQLDEAGTEPTHKQLDKLSTLYTEVSTLYPSSPI